MEVTGGEDWVCIELVLSEESDRGRSWDEWFRLGCCHF